MAQPRILLIVGGGIAAYKSCELVRLIRKAGGEVTCVLTDAGAQFVTPMTLGTLSENQVHTSLWDLKDEVEIGHIQLSRQADLVVVCPATADLLAKMAAGIADDLATTLLLATDKPVLAVPAMNVRMWLHAATRRNVAWLKESGVRVMEPDEGEMACGEFGPGRLPEPEAIWREIGQLLKLVTRDDSAAEPDLTHPLMAPEETVEAALPPERDARVLREQEFDPLAGQPDFDGDPAHRPLYGKHVLVTAGPTHEPIDPVRYIANRSSGRQGFAIAAAAAAAGARVTLVSGPVTLETPPGVDRVDVESAQEMDAAVKSALPADAAVLVAAVADWRADYEPHKIKKQGSPPPALALTENPDILAGLARGEQRPRLLIGFAAETENLLPNARKKLKNKGADWIVANDVSGDTMGGADNQVTLVRESGEESWEPMAKEQVARQLVERMADELA
jgi:phosphopantothenoylcysteine decarboxylase/phosphopantothenate--cysteine ligase